MNPGKRAILAQNERYTQQVNALLDLLAQHDEALLNRKPADGGWSAIQTLHHVLMAEEFALAYVKKKLGFNPTFEKVGLRGAWRGFLVWASLNAPFKIKAPNAVGDDNLPKQASLADTRARWDAVRSAWSSFLAEMPDALADKMVYKHPAAGRLGWAQTFIFFREHLKRHRAQALRALR
jgi:uncharacterized damage-inducible protein DinB